MEPATSNVVQWKSDDFGKTQKFWVQFYFIVEMGRGSPPEDFKPGTHL